MKHGQLRISGSRGLCKKKYMNGKRHRFRLDVAPPSTSVGSEHAHDLALWLVRMAEAEQGGLFNVTGPDGSLTMGQFLDACNTVVSGGSTLTWIDDQFLVDRDVAYWSELPLWLPESAPWRLDIGRAIQSGLEFRPISQTIADIRAWLGSSLLEEWKQRSD